MKKPLKLPKFASEDEERDFWAKIDLADYFESKPYQALIKQYIAEGLKT